MDESAVKRIIVLDEVTLQHSASHILAFLVRQRIESKGWQLQIEFSGRGQVRRDGEFGGD